MTDELKPEERDALTAALENDGLFNCGPLPPGPGFLWEYGGDGAWELTPAGTAETFPERAGVDPV